MHTIQVNAAIEGPVVLNDIAFELCREFVAPAGDRFLRQIRLYVDIMGDVLQKPGYLPGTAAKFVLPFLKAAGLTNARMQEFSRQNLKFMPGARGAYRFFIHLGVPVFLLSTSYRPFALALAQELKIAEDRVCATDVDLDRYSLAEAEKIELERLKKAILETPDLPAGVSGATARTLPAQVKDTIDQFDRIFTETIPAMGIGRLLEDAATVGDAEKLAAVKGSFGQTKLALENVLYVGDNVTDAEAFEAVAGGGGVGISFNGAPEAAGTAQVIVVSDSAWSVALLASIYRRWGKEGVYELMTMTQAAQQKILAIPAGEIEPLMTGLEGRLFNLYPADTPKLAQVKEESSAMRRRLREAARG
jgi:predicted HAD superfamily phosphohydrolase